MGMDTIELVMELEDEFELSIPDREAEKLVTVGQTYEYILRRLSERHVERCFSATAFYRLRRELMSECGIARREIRPDRRIGDLLIDPADRKKWKKIAQRTHLPFARFDLLHPTAFRLRNPDQTLRELIHSKGPGCYLRSDGSVCPEAVWRRILEIVSEQSGVPVDQLRAETHYIDDLF
jgi:acyl carrier protein